MRGYYGSCLHQSTKTAIVVRLTMPSSPHEFFKVFLLSSDYRPSVDRPSTERWPITDRYISEVSTNYRRSVGEVSVNEKLYRPRHIWNDYRPCLDRVSSDYRPSLYRLSTAISAESRPTIDQLSTDYRPSVDRLSTAISTDRSVDTTYTGTWSADFCLGLSVVPSLFFFDIYLLSWVNFIRWLSSNTSVVNLCVLVLDRFIDVVHPLKYITFRQTVELSELFSSLGLYQLVFTR